MSPAPVAERIPNTRDDLMRYVDALANEKVKRLLKAKALRRVHPYNPVGPFKPRMELIDDPESPLIVATIELPGVKKRDLTTSVRDGHLIIQGERRAPSYRLPPSANQTERFGPQTIGIAVTDGTVETRAGDSPPVPPTVQELVYGTYRRAIPLPAGSQQSDIQTSLLDGMLMVTWPRSPSPASGHPYWTVLENDATIR